MDYSYDKILEQLLLEIPLNPQDKVYGITFIGGQGFGKSTVAKMLSKKLGLYITVNDRIRRLYDELGFDNKVYEDDIKKMANDRTIYLLKNKTSHIIDANMEFFYEMAINNYSKYDAKLFFIELTCSEEEALKRIRNRIENSDDNYSCATEEDYYKYLEKKKTHSFPKDKIFYTINTENNLEEIEKSVDLLVEKIKNELYVGD